MRLFFLTIPKPLKQHPILKKNHPFRSPRRKLYELEAIFNDLGEKLPVPSVKYYRMYSQVLYPRATILAEWLRHFNGLAVGETAAPARFLRENAEAAGMPPLLSH